jgi:CDP-glucose 4,6-dehydratase
LKLNCDKALHHLFWHAVWDFETTVRETTTWYREFYQAPHRTIAEFSLKQIATCVADEREQGIPWAQ